MRILFTVIPEKTIFMSMVPLAWALRTAGHEVHIACQPAFTDTVTQAGLTAVPVGRNSVTARINDHDPEGMEKGRHGLPNPWDVAEFPERANWDLQVAGHREVVESAHKPDNFPMINGLVAYARHWEPDVVIWEPFSYAGSIAAKACGAASARLLWSIDVFGVTRQTFLGLKDQQPEGKRTDPLADWLGGYARKYGDDFTEDLTVGHFSIDQLPPSLAQQAEGLQYTGLQYIPYNGAAVVPNWLRTPPERPRVALTLGLTAATQFAGYTVDVQDILTTLADLDIELVATIAESEQRKLSHVPENTRVVQFAPLNALSATCDVVISHAGPGTFLTAARHGVPQLTVPAEFDAPELARRAMAQGGSLCVQAESAGEITQSIREGVLRLLNEPGLRQRAEALDDEIRAMPSPNEFVAHLEQLTLKHRTR